MIDFCSVVTTYNELWTVRQLVQALLPRGPVIVVDACSTDDTAAIARLAGAEVFITENRIGIGPALRHGWILALKKKPKRILQIDAGGSHDPNDVDQMLSSSADLVIGSRFLGTYTGGPWYRPLGSRLVTKFCNWLNHTSITDWTSGYRLFSPVALQYLADLKYQAVMHAWQIEVLQAVLRYPELTIEERPIHYFAGRSSFSIKAALETMRVITKQL